MLREGAVLDFAQIKFFHDALTVESETTNDMLQCKASNEHVHKFSGASMETVRVWSSEISHMYICAPARLSTQRPSGPTLPHLPHPPPIAQHVHHCGKSTIGSHVAAPQDDSP